MPIGVIVHGSIFAGASTVVAVLEPNDCAGIDRGGGATSFAPPPSLSTAEEDRDSAGIICRRGDAS